MRYRIYRMKDVPQENFRWSAHTRGAAVLKPKDYEAAGEIEAISPYAAWKLSAEAGCPLQPGDVLESLDKEGRSVDLRISKYIGFEAAEWFVAVQKSNIMPETGPSETANSELISQSS